MLGADRLRGVLVHPDDLARGDEAQVRVAFEERLHALRPPHDHRLDTQLGRCLGRARDRLLRRVVAPHAVDRYAHEHAPERARCASPLHGPTSDVEVAHALGVGLDELLARFDV